MWLLLALCCVLLASHPTAATDCKPERCTPVETVRSFVDGLALTLTGTKIEFTLDHGAKGSVLSGQLGGALPPELGQPTACSDGDICWHWGDAARLTVAKEEDADVHCYNVSWRTKALVAVEDCIDIGSAFWFAGQSEVVQHFPLRTSTSRQTVPLIPADMLQDRKYFGGLAEPYWLSSEGVFVWADEGIPLFFSWNADNSSRFCLSANAKHQAPYFTGAGIDTSRIAMDYKLCTAPDAKQAQLFAAEHLFGKPTGIPDERMIALPVWSTWAQYKTAINESVVIGFADDIRSHGFKDSQIEIDDNWETCYGELKFDPAKFPDPARMIRQIKDKDFRVTLWIHPFVNIQCPIWSQVATAPKGFFVRDTKGRDPPLNSVPGFTFWWQGDVAGYVDVTNPSAAKWFQDRLEALRTDFGIDAFKFDAGDAYRIPSSYLLDASEPASTWPAVYVTRFAETMAHFGGQIEIRVGRKTQHVPVFVRMLDKDSKWDYDNGLKTMITSLLQMGIAGYPFVLPDMIGGNGYEGQPAKELYVRWMQVNVFMPAMQFSYVPWLYDDQVIAYALNMTGLHEQYASTFVALGRQAMADGSPINRPVWWADPTDKTAFAIDSEFLLGDDLLVAPVLEEGAVTRDIYLPVGHWRDEADPKHPIFEGPIWIRGYPADLWTLPYFTRA